MQTGSNGDVERLIENAAEIGGRQRLGLKTERPNAPSGIAMAKNRHTVDLLEPSA